jgi:hypothetical protein
MGTGDLRPDRHTEQYLRDVQYTDGTKLGDRIALHQRFSTNPTGWHRWLYDLIAPRSAERVLEVGCGCGTLWTTNAARLPEAVALVLTDFSPGMLDSAREALTAARMHASPTWRESKRAKWAKGDGRNDCRTDWLRRLIGRSTRRPSAEAGGPTPSSRACAHHRSRLGLELLGLM